MEKSLKPLLGAASAAMARQAAALETRRLTLARATAAAQDANRAARRALGRAAPPTPTPAPRKR
jgi:hypothetical protein